MTTPCPRCQRPANVSAKHPICSRCQAAIRTQAEHEQERDYLARYLSTRAHEYSMKAVRLRQLAKREGIDWTHPPQPIHFDARVAALMQPYTTGNKQRGRPKRRDVSTTVMRVSLWDRQASA